MKANFYNRIPWPCICKSLNKNISQVNADLNTENHIANQLNHKSELQPRDNFTT